MCLFPDILEHAASSYQGREIAEKEEGCILIVFLMLIEGLVLSCFGLKDTWGSINDVKQTGIAISLKLK